MILELTRSWVEKLAVFSFVCVCHRLCLSILVNSGLCLCVGGIGAWLRICCCVRGCVRCVRVRVCMASID